MARQRPSAPAAALRRAFRRANIGEQRCARCPPAAAPARLYPPRPSPTRQPPPALLYSRAPPSFPVSRPHTSLPAQPLPPPLKRRCRLSNAFQRPASLPGRDELPAAARCPSLAAAPQVHPPSWRLLRTPIQACAGRFVRPTL